MASKKKKCALAKREKQKKKKMKNTTREKPKKTPHTCIIHVKHLKSGVCIYIVYKYIVNKHQISAEFQMECFSRKSAIVGRENEHTFHMKTARVVETTTNHTQRRFTSIKAK